MKKVKSVEAPDDNKITFKAQIFLSHRTWEATILEQVPDERIVWRSKGQKGHVDGAVTFHEIGPNLTRILVVLEYYPQGLFEKTGNIWGAQGRRARAELRHFRRHVMTRTILDPDEVEGWRGTIEDGEVVESHEDAVEREEQEEQDEQEQDESGDEGDEPGEDEEPEDEYESEDEEAPRTRRPTEDEDAAGRGRVRRGRVRGGGGGRGRARGRVRVRRRGPRKRRPPRTRTPRTRKSPLTTSTRRRGRKRTPPRTSTRTRTGRRGRGLDEEELPRTMRPGSLPMRIPRTSTKKKKRKRSSPPEAPSPPCQLSARRRARHPPTRKEAL